MPNDRRRPPPQPQASEPGRGLLARVASAVKDYWVPISHQQAQSFLSDQFRANHWAWRAAMIVGTLVFSLRGIGDAFSGILSRDLFVQEAILRLGVTGVLVGFIYGFERARDMNRGQWMVAGFVFTLVVGLIGTVFIVPERAIHALFPITFVYLIATALWLQGPQLAWGLGAALVPTTVLVLTNSHGGADASTYFFYIGLAVVLGMVLRHGRLLVAFDAFLLRRRLAQAAHNDPLTGTLNRAGWESTLAQAGPDGHPLPPASLLYFDLDKFKAVNDTYGHPIGDLLLQETAKLVRPMLREHDVLARFGGEEFVAFLPGVDANGARLVAERIRQAMADRTGAPAATLSIGVAELGENETVDQALGRADRALLRAKQAGRNRVELAEA